MAMASARSEVARTTAGGKPGVGHAGRHPERAGGHRRVGEGGLLRVRVRLRVRGRLRVRVRGKA